MILGVRSKMTVDELNCDEEYEIMNLRIKLNDRSEMFEDFTLRKNQSGMIEISGVSPSRWCNLWDDGPDLLDSFCEVQYAQLIHSACR